MQWQDGCEFSKSCLRCHPRWPWCSVAGLGRARGAVDGVVCPEGGLIKHLLQGLAQTSCLTACLQGAEFPSRVSSCSSLSWLCSFFSPAAFRCSQAQLGHPSPPSAPLMCCIELQVLRISVSPDLGASQLWHAAHDCCWCRQEQTATAQACISLPGSCGLLDLLRVLSKGRKCHNLHQHLIKSNDRRQETALLRRPLP